MSNHSKAVCLALSITIPLLISVLLVPAFAQSPDEAAVRETIGLYFQAQATGNGDLIRKAFHPDAKLFWVRDGQLQTRTAEEFAAGFNGRPAADEAQRKRSIDSIDIRANAAFVKITLDYPNVRFTDYMSLLKIDGRWLIINKSFVSEPKSAAR